MTLHAGTIIKSTAALNNTYFKSATIVIAEYNNNGAIGLVINKTFHRKLNELEDFKYLSTFRLFEGGPVDQEHLFFIHNRPDLITGGTLINNSIYFGGDFKRAINCIHNKSITTNNIKIFTGYCGWNYAELEEEVNEGSWQIATNDEKIFIF